MKDHVVIQVWSGPEQRWGVFTRAGGVDQEGARIFDTIEEAQTLKRQLDEADEPDEKAQPA